MTTQAEIERRYNNMRTAMEREGVDALLVCGSEYSGFEGAARYLSGFEIVHRYMYVLLPLRDDPQIIFPSEARWVGDKKKPWVRDHIFAEVPGDWIRDRAQSKGWKRLAVHGLDFVMPVRDHNALSNGSLELVRFDVPFDLARAVKSEEELVEVRDSMDIIQDGFWVLVEAYEPGKSEAEILAPAVERFFARGSGPRMMNIVLCGEHGQAEPHFKVPGDRTVNDDDLMLYSLEVTGQAGYWVEFSRPLIRGGVSHQTQAMVDPYPEALEEARLEMRAGRTAGDVHKAAADIFARHGFGLGHLSGHSIGLTMLEYPAIGAGVDVPLEENMIFSFHPQVIDKDGTICLYTQDTFRIGKTEGENLSKVPWGFYNGTETP